MTTETIEAPAQCGESKVEDLAPEAAEEEAAAAEAYTFHHLGEASWPNLHAKDLAEFLHKWNVDEHSHIAKFRFDQKFERFDAEQFIRDFFCDGSVRAHIQVAHAHGGMGSAQFPAPSAVRFELLSTTATNMDLFDVLKTEELSSGTIVRGDGKIGGCFEDWEEGVCIQDRLRLAMCKFDTEEYDVFPEHVRKELLFQVFRTLTLGGSMCQWEDTVDKYLEATKRIYKDFVRVRKDPDSGRIQVATLAYKVHGLPEAEALFPNPTAPNNVCFVLIDPVPRHVTFFYHGVVGFM